MFCFCWWIVDLEVDEVQLAEAVDKDGDTPLLFLGEFAFLLCIYINFSWCHLVDGDAFPWHGCDEDFVWGLGFFAAPRDLSHGAKEAASTLGWSNFYQLLENFPIEGKLLQLWEGEMAEAVVPLHQLSLLAGCGKLGFLSLLQRRWGVKGEWPLSCGLGRTLLLRRRQKLAVITVSLSSFTPSLTDMLFS